MSKEEFDCEFQALISEREAMLAENRQREHLEEAMAYGDSAFCANAKVFRELAKQWKEELKKED
jgi:hypothetical protein